MPRVIVDSLIKSSLYVNEALEMRIRANMSGADFLNCRTHSGLDSNRARFLNFLFVCFLKNLLEKVSNSWPKKSLIEIKDLSFYSNKEEIQKSGSIRIYL